MTLGCVSAGLLLLGSLAADAAAQPPITAAAFAPDGQAVLVGSQRGIEVRALPALNLARTLATKLQQVHDLRFAPGSELFAAVGGSPGESGAVELHRWPDGELLHVARLDADVAYQLAWSWDGAKLALAGPDHEVLWLDRSLAIQQRVTGHSQDAMTVAFLPDGHLVSGSRDQTLRVWREGELVRTLSNHVREVWDVAVRPGVHEPTVIASASEDRTIRLWWPVRGRMLRFARLPSPALDIAWTIDGRHLLAACADGRLRAVDPETVQVVRDVPVGEGWLYTVAVSPDGESVFVGGTEGVMRLLATKSILDGS